MKDAFERPIHYLRISVTDLCNLRCIYCMPERGTLKRPHEEILTVEEILQIAEIAVGLGIDKIRLTGGEPLVRRGILDIVKGIASISGLKDLAMTTNGILLPQYIYDLKQAGLKRLNISLDSLDKKCYRSITRRDYLEDALRGLQLALHAGFEKIKINTVLLGDINDSEIVALAELTEKQDVTVRFIELMPIGESALWPKNRFISSEKVLQLLPELKALGKEGVSELYQLPRARGKIGLIRPLSHEFCGSCNRIRLTADGKLKPCLHSPEEIQLKGLSHEEIEKQMTLAIQGKPRGHNLLAASSRSRRGMHEIGG